ncbi:hypothetical protein [Amycolatopsis sp. lyj-346]|uniref:hypothetical protein n=1 Tax=Amycolatopsis sp. lyj-346 TaxID=2789289 RepID=UPI00397C3B1D
MGEFAGFEPAPPVVLPPSRSRSRTWRRLLVAALVVVVLVVVIVVLTREPGPGEPGWQPLTGEVENHSSTGAAGLQFAQVLANDEDSDVVIESVRAEVPAGLTVKEPGQLPLGWFTEGYWLTPPKLIPLPVTAPAGHKIKFVVRFHVSCPPAKPATRIPWRLFLTVRSGPVRQEVEVGSLRPIELVDSALPEFCG